MITIFITTSILKSPNPFIDAFALRLQASQAWQITSSGRGKAKFNY